MPNWTTNYVAVTGPEEVLKRFRSECCSGESETIDFEKVIPFPEGFDRELQSPMAMDCRVLSSGQVETFDWIPAEAQASAEKCAAFIATRRWPLTDEEIAVVLASINKRLAGYARNVELGGCMSWYDFCAGNWGTKWPACDADPIKVVKTDDKLLGYQFTFNTAWDAPRGIIDALQEKYDALKWTWVCIHEDGSEKEVICDDAEAYVNTSVELEIHD